ncbi:hypothetical protein [Aliarcobacter butzleri]|uniref:hypothetical protein n=1 Tax=Aliarcobacter butzleri TaxID=28197 RepID=UPI002B253891|nr:hypothetical protein [Aliarcobacter butzleri]
MKTILFFFVAVLFCGCTEKVVYVEKVQQYKKVDKEENSITDTFARKFNIKVSKKENNNSLFGIAINHFGKE